MSPERGAASNSPGVWVGTDFLERYNEGNPVLDGGQLLVIGGGNTALDAARIGRRSGAEGYAFTYFHERRG